MAFWSGLGKLIAMVAAIVKQESFSEKASHWCPQVECNLHIVLGDGPIRACLTLQVCLVGKSAANKNIIVESRAVVPAYVRHARNVESTYEGTYKQHAANIALSEAYCCRPPAH